MTKQDIRNGKNTGSPVSRTYSASSLALVSYQKIPGCKVESTIFFAFQISAFISPMLPCLYPATKLFACSNPALLTSKVLHREDISRHPLKFSHPYSIPTTERELNWDAPFFGEQDKLSTNSPSPGIRKICRMPDSTPVCTEIILRGW